MKEVVFKDKKKFLDYLQTTMQTAAKNLEFEEAARIRDQIEQVEKEL
ncbi:MAG: UvrB/UvrC motif-containing protein [Balneolales bacterium]